MVSKIDELNLLVSKSDNICDVLNVIKKTFNDMKCINPEEVNAQMIDKLFDKIIATPIPDTEMDLLFVLNNGNTLSSKYLSKHGKSLALHSGNTINSIAVHLYACISGVKLGIFVNI